jgi:hypothetical protein
MQIEKKTYEKWLLREIFVTQGDKAFRGESGLSKVVSKEHIHETWSKHVRCESDQSMTWTIKRSDDRKIMVLVVESVLITNTRTTACVSKGLQFRL